MIPSDHLRTLRNDVPVLSVIHTLHIPTKKRGARLTFRCPNCRRFHTATKAATNLAHCFPCQLNWNPIDLVIAERGCRFLDAVRYLQGLIGYQKGGVTTAPTRLLVPSRTPTSSRGVTTAGGGATQS